MPNNVAPLSEIEALRAENARLRARLEQAERLADSDSLTGVANRRCIMREIGRAAAAVARCKISASLLFADMNNLKAINDSLGHAAGDRALMHVAAILVEQTRATDLVARIGGDEFAVLLTHADAAQAAAATGRIAAAIALRPFRAGGAERLLGVAIGSALIGPADTAELVLARADDAMYRHKLAHRSDR